MKEEIKNKNDPKGAILPWWRIGGCGRLGGFTLVELLVVISIVSILVLATSSSFINSQKKSRDVSRKSDLKSLADALNMYYADKGVFPVTDNVPNRLGEFADYKGNIYMKKVPAEKSSGLKAFKYIVSSDYKSFRLCANLENNEDKDCLKPQDSCGTLCGYSVSVGCCYTITSSNASLTDPLP